MTVKNKIYRYPAYLQIKFPEGLQEVKFIKEIDGFNYLFIKRYKDCKINLPEQFEQADLPEEFLQKIKQEKYQEIEVLRKNLQFKNIIYQNTEYSASQMARQNIVGIITTSGNSSDKYYWKDVKGNAHQLSINDFKEILQIISSRDSKIYELEESARNTLNIIVKSNPLDSIGVFELWEKCEKRHKLTKESKK